MKNAPDIRFNRFTEDWEQRKLSDEFTDFIVPMRDKPKEFGGNIPWTRIEDIEGKYLNGSLSDQYVTEETIKKMNLKIIPKDSLIVSSSATFGVVAIVTQDLITNQTFIGLVPNDKKLLDYWYAFFHSDSARQYMKLQSAGSTIFYIARENFENMPIVIPTNREMLKIGAYFTNLDNLITLHQRKLDKLKQFKESMLDKMFPKDGAKVPEIRFAGFTGDWEQRELGDICEYHSSSLTAKDVYEDGSYDLYDANSLIGKTNKGCMEKDYITIIKDGASVGRTRLLPKNSMFLGTMGALTPRNSDLDFLYQLITKADLGKTYTGSTIPHIYFKDYEKNIYCIPSCTEQQVIGSYFRNLDHLITLHQRKLDKLKQFKESMLNKMYI